MRASDVKFTLLALAAALALTLGSAAAVSAQTAAPAAAIGVFDLQKVLGDSKKGKAARDELKKNFDKKQAELKAKEDEINKLSAELRQLASSGSAKNDDLRKKDETLKAKVAEYQKQLAKSNEDMRKDEEQKLKPIVDKAVKTAGELAKSKGYIMVLETQQAGVVFALETLDMTADIIKAVDS